MSVTKQPQVLLFGLLWTVHGCTESHVFVTSDAATESVDASSATIDVVCPETAPRAGSRCRVDAVTACQYSCASDASLVAYCFNETWQILASSNTTPQLANHCELSVNWPLREPCPVPSQANNSSCEYEGHTCRYACGENRVFATCRQGAWQFTQTLGPSCTLRIEQHLGCPLTLPLEDGCTSALGFGSQFFHAGVVCEYPERDVSCLPPIE